MDNFNYKKYIAEGRLFKEDFKNPILDKYLELKKSIDYKTVFPTDLQSFVDSLDNTERGGLESDLAEGKLLKEASDLPKAIILAGAPGAGKGYILRGLDLGGIKVLNVDDIYVPLLTKSNITLDLKNATPEERSGQAKAMAAANKEFKGNVDSTIENKESFILDGTGASYNQTLKLKNELEETGYKVFMLYVYTDLQRSLSQNQDRYEKSGGKDRSLAPAIVMRTWKGVTDNLPKYAELFGNNFVAVANTLDDRMQDIDKIIKKYLTPFAPQGTKPKTPKEQAKSDARKAKDKEEIQIMLSDDFIYDVVEYTMSKEEAQMRIEKFLNS